MQGSAFRHGLTMSESAALHQLGLTMSWLSDMDSLVIQRVGSPWHDHASEAHGWVASLACVH